METFLYRIGLCTPALTERIDDTIYLAPIIYENVETTNEYKAIAIATTLNPGTEVVSWEKIK